MKITRSLLALALGMLAGCAGNVIVVDGIEVYENHWNKTVTELRPRASFDMNCPAEQLQFTLIKRMGRAPSEVGVQGCDRRAMYIRGPYSPWVMNTGSSDPSSATEPNASTSPSSI